MTLRKHRESRMTIVGELILGYIVAILMGKMLRKQNAKMFLFLILITAAQVALVMYEMFTNVLELPGS